MTVKTTLRTDYSQQWEIRAMRIFLLYQLSLKTTSLEYKVHLWI